MSPALFPGPYPSAFLYSEPCPLTDKEKKKERENKHVRATESSLNPWDYLAEDGESPEGSSAPLLNEAAIGGQRKPRRRFNNEELQCLEIFWAISHDHKKYARQRLGAWLGVATRHITFWVSACTRPACVRADYPSCRTVDRSGRRTKVTALPQTTLRLAVAEEAPSTPPLAR